MRLRHSLVVERSPEEVYAFLADPANLPKWQSGVVEVRKEAIGRHVEVRSFLGKRIEQTLVVTAAEPGSLLELSVVSGPLPLRVSHTLEPVGRGTRITVVGEGELRGVLRLAAGMALKAIEKQSEHDFAKLKRVLEGRME